VVRGRPGNGRRDGFSASKVVYARPLKVSPASGTVVRTWGF